MKKVNKYLLALLLVPLFVAAPAFASDHDDGEFDGKGRNLNLTDHFAFREDNFELNSGLGTPGSATNLVLIMNSNPRSLPQQQYFFSTTAVYDFHVSRVGTNNDVVPPATDDVILRFQFGAPNSSNVQAITMTTIVNGVSTVATGTATTTAFGVPSLPAPAATINTLTVGARTFTVFAGLRADPFYFDVQSFFAWRSKLAGGATSGTAGSPSTDGINFAFGYNVNSIVVRLPIAFLQTSAAETVFDTWSTVSVPK